MGANKKKSKTQSKQTVASQLQALMSKEENLGRFGLKNEQDVVSFISSTAGKSLIAEITEQVGFEKAKKEQLQIQQLEQDILMQRIRIASLMWSVERDDQSLRQQEATIIQLNTQAIQRSGKAPEIAATAIQTPYQTELLASISTYRTAIDKNLAQLEVLNAKGLQLANQMAALQVEGAMLTQKYALLDRALGSDFEAGIIGRLGHSSNEEDILEVDKEVNRMNTELAKMEHEVDTAKPDRASELRMTINVHKHVLSMQQDIFEVRTRQKYFADINGMEVDSFKNAHFILGLDQRILKDTKDQFYLVARGQEMEDLNADPSLKNQAQIDFELQKPALLFAKELKNLNKAMEFQTYENNVSVVVLETQKTNNIRAQLMAETRTFQTKLVESELAYEASKDPLQTPSQAGADTDRPRVRFAPSPTPDVTAASIAITQKYKERISDFKLQHQDQPLTKKDIEALKDELSQNRGNPEAIKYLQKLAGGMQQDGSLSKEQSAKVFSNLEAYAEPELQQGRGLSM
jgi:effector protein LidA